MTVQWQPYREPLRVTLVRTGTIALVLGALLARSLGGGLARWPMSILLMLWPAFGMTKRPPGNRFVTIRWPGK